MDFSPCSLYGAQTIRESKTKLLTGMFGLQTKSALRSGALVGARGQVFEVWLFQSHDNKHECEESKKKELKVFIYSKREPLINNLLET